MHPRLVPTIRRGAGWENQASRHSGWQTSRSIELTRHIPVLAVSLIKRPCHQ